jgi:hypothetical protein
VAEVLVLLVVMAFVMLVLMMLLMMINSLFETSLLISKHNIKKLD